MFTTRRARTATLRAMSTNGHCAECAEPLAPDQRYCLACGARRGPLPDAAARLIFGAPPAPEAPDDPEEAPRGFAMPGPRAAALAVMAVLAFGVVVGTLVGPPALSAADTPLLVAVAQPPAPTPTPTPAPTPQPAAHEPASKARAPAAPAATPASTPAPTPAPTPEPIPTGPTLPAVQHVFLIALSGHGYDEAFGDASAAPYLSGSLRAKGELISNYYAVAQGELANEIALVSGQGPTAQIAANCPQYTDIAPGTVGSDGQVSGDGCVFPTQAQTLGDQLVAAGASWKSYVESMPVTCRHPALGAPDPEHDPQPGAAYVTWRDPFAYFHSAIDAPSCGENLVGLDQLGKDLGAAATTPSFSLIVPDRCHDGSDDPCAPGAPAGLAAADEWLRTVVPQILNSPAYRSGGLLAITFDQAPQDGPNADSSSCCNQPVFPNLGAAGAATPTPSASATPTVSATPTAIATPTPTPSATPTPTVSATPTTTPAPATTTVPGTPVGGGRVGLLLVSRFVKPGSVNVLGSYNHYSLLRSIEDLFSLDHLGYAADPALPAFDKVVYNGG
jgi:phosphatidylinositol-3-phosphatase